MSTNITEVVNKIREIVPLLFTDRAELSDPYNLDDSSNTSIMLKKGWGLRIRRSVPTIDGICQQHRTKRSIEIVLTEQLKRLRSDRGAIHTESLDLLEDAVKLELDFLNPDKIEIPDNFDLLEFQDNSGIDFIYREKTTFIYTVTSFGIDIAEII